MFDILKYYKVYEPYSVCCHSGTLLLLSGDVCGRRRVYIKFFKNNKKKKILLVDDDSDTTWLSKTALERNGFEVQTFGSPIAVLENFKPGSYDLLLIDIKMKEMDGFELYDKLRKMDNNINVCFLTAAQEYYTTIKSVILGYRKNVL